MASRQPYGQWGVTTVASIIATGILIIPLTLSGRIGHGGRPRLVSKRSPLSRPVTVEPTCCSSGRTVVSTRNASLAVTGAVSLHGPRRRAGLQWQGPH